MAAPSGPRSSAQRRTSIAAAPSERANPPGGGSAAAATTGALAGASAALLLRESIQQHCNVQYGLSYKVAPKVAEYLSQVDRSTKTSQTFAALQQTRQIVRQQRLQREPEHSKGRCGMVCDCNRILHLALECVLISSTSATALLREFMQRGI